MITINENWCKGCGICIDRCPLKALEISDKFNAKGVHIPRLKDKNICNECRLCELLCPDLAISVVTNKDKKRGNK